MVGARVQPQPQPQASRGGGAGGGGSPATRPAFRLVRTENVMNPALIGSFRQALRASRARSEEVRGRMFN
jgi:hypothetical protein